MSAGPAPPITGTLPLTSGAAPQVTGAPPQVTGAPPQVTGALPQVTGALPLVTGALPLVTYVWHYLVARLVYDELLRPVVHGHVAVLLPICGATVGGFLVGWLTGRRPASRRRG